MHIRPSRFVLPELNQIAVFPIDDAYRIANINNIQQNFVLHRQIDINPTTNEVNGFMILGTDIFLSRLICSEYVSGDGTFRVAPQPFEQMYTFSFFVRRIENRLVIKKLFGGIYVLMSHKNTFLYEKILVWLLEYAVQHNIQVLWHHFMADFELAVKKSIQYIFGDILQWHGCYFHFGQAIQRMEWRIYDIL